MMKITSVTNSKVKHVVKLRQKKARRDARLTIVEGVREIFCALRQNVPCEEMYVCSELVDPGTWQKLQQRFTKLTQVYEVNRAVYKKIAYGDREEGLLAVCSPAPRALCDLKVKKDGLIVVIDQVEKPGNIGAILRSCDGGGVDALLVSDPLVDIYNPNIIRASLGTVFSVSIVQDQRQAILNFLKENLFQVLAAAPSAKKNYSQVNLKGPTAIVLGSEQDGLDAFWLKQCDQQIKLPMRGQADSLNVSATSAILIYEALRQRS